MSNRVRYITVPKNAKGIEEYEKGIEGTDNLFEIQLSDAEFMELATKGVFKDLNKKFSLLIDDYESEIVDAEKLKEYMANKTSENGNFFHAIEKAIEYNTFIALDF